MALERYRQKRNFKSTAEPRGNLKNAKHSGHSFVIQKHAASRLHYDFRLELDGVLKSWAVPKGPSLDPEEKRLAVHVEDHPLEYASFEGIIPPRQYGGGTVMVWDQGTWIPDGDAAEGYRKGKLKFRLEGEKLHGGWTLVRMHGQDDAEQGKQNWLLIKEHDEEARPGSAAAIVEEKTSSVITGRDLDEIATAKDRVWQSKGKPTEAAKPDASAKAATKAAPKSVSKKAAASATTQKNTPAPVTTFEPDLAALRKTKMPDMLAPQLALRVDQAPAGENWFHEIKYDGYRMLSRIDGGKTGMFSRNAKDWTERCQPLADELAKLPVDQAWLDGEVVVVMPNGTTSFQALQDAFGGGKYQLVYYVFDLVYLNGRDLSDMPLRQRKVLLSQLLAAQCADGPIRYSDHLEGDGADFFHHACHHGLEGIISKRADAPYRATRSKDWVKVKCEQRQEFVIGGYTEPGGARTKFGALLIGVYDENGALEYSCKVGTGFNEQSLKEIYARLLPLEQAKAPFSNPPTGYEAKGAHWVKPVLVAEVAFTEWTSEGAVRHPSFQGLREDKVATDVTRETIAPLAVAVAKKPAKSKPVKSSPAPEPQPVKKPARKEGPVKVAGIVITHPDRVLYPETSITKLDLAEYYENVAPWLLPQLKNRPLTLVRCPQGGGGKCFFQKHMKETIPDVVETVMIEQSDGPADYMLANTAAAAVALVQMGVLEIHTWGAHKDKLHQPDRIIFDLDPGPDIEWEQLVDAAKTVRDRLAALGLKSFVKTSGSKGLHVEMPMVRKYNFDEIKAFSKAIADDLAASYPERFTAKIAKVKRGGKIFIDYLRNGEGATAVAAFSTRARPGAPVATPLAWSELDDPALRANTYTIRNVMQRLENLKVDPWADYASLKQSITPAMMQALGIK